ncbi:hypothetical protein [Bradyrhizobium sp. CIR3A]|uniref:hypothetical protein n=1 Tax=Bradyrhizobium sp. CIR3A TaxID=2663838 RepID=UPI0016060578|nr:hypothetical protein [Bradyrhizobium sp. CIR3A]MBB4258730.1 hypothetical protein [Bradyrhizobium sp. CIR3A]
MKYVLICTVIGFVAGWPLTLLLARKKPTLAWWLAIGSNMPTLVMLLSLSSGDLYVFLALGLLVGLGLGGFGLGALCGIVNASLFGTEPPRWSRKLRQKIDEARG